jgi:hypothetical protein
MFLTAQLRDAMNAGRGYEAVRTLEAGATKEARDKNGTKRRSQEDLVRDWDADKRSGLFQCDRCRRISTSKPNQKHYDSRACQKKDAMPCLCIRMMGSVEKTHGEG